MCTPLDGSVVEQQLQQQLAFVSESAWEFTPAIPPGLELQFLSSLASPQAPSQDQSQLWAPSHCSSYDCGTVIPLAKSAEEALERKQAVNRNAQKRFRERRKARSQAVEQQLADTMAELDQLRIRQQQLETNNMLLKKVSQLSAAKGASPQSWTDASWEEMFAPYQRGCCQDEPVITASLWGQQQSLTVQDIGKLSRSQFALIWTEYTHEIGGLLLQLADVQLANSSNSAAEQQLDQLTRQALDLVGCLCVVNPGVKAAAMKGKLDTSAEHEPSLMSYSDHQAMVDLSEEQADDLMYLRKVYLSRRGALLIKRQTHLASMSAQQLPHPSDSLGSLLDFSTVMKEHAMQDYKAYHQLCFAMGYGVYTTKQMAVWVVHAYPCIPNIEAALDVLAMKRQEPSKQAILASASISPMTSEWNKLAYNRMYNLLLPL